MNDSEFNALADAALQDGWQDTRGGEELMTALSRLLSEQAGESISLRD